MPRNNACFRALLLADGMAVGELRQQLSVTRNVVRQHLTALTTQGFARRTQPRATGGRPQARYVIAPAGRHLFTRNYDAIAAVLMTELQARLGPRRSAALLQHADAAATVSQPRLSADSDMASTARGLAEYLDALGYEVSNRGSGGWQVEAFNCVFCGLARQHPEVSRFDPP